MSSTDFPSVRDFVAAVGRDNFQSALGHSTQVVSRAITEGAMPAHWFVAVRDWCAESGIEVPEHLFKWSRKTATTDFLDSLPADQDGNVT